MGHLTSINIVPKGIIVTIKEQSNWFPQGIVLAPPDSPPQVLGSSQMPIEIGVVYD
jgi:hypothetical protein